MLLHLHPSPQELHPVCWSARTWMILLVVTVLVGSWLLTAAPLDGRRAAEPGSVQWETTLMAPVSIFR